jgi:hypothetical protein
MAGWDFSKGKKHSVESELLNPPPRKKSKFTLSSGFIKKKLTLKGQLN